jgi:murein DD-endopeptidase MepM/ murein hydrolase activator NlpD
MRATLARRRRLTALVSLLAAMPLLFSSLGGIPSTHADQIEDALQRQRELRAQVAANQDTLNGLRQAEAMLSQALAATAAQLESITADLHVVESEITAASAALKVVETRYAELVAQLDHLDWTVAVLEEELVQAEADLEQRKRQLAQRLGEAYRTQQTSMLEQVFTSDSFTQVLSNVGSHLRFGDQDADLAKGIARDQKALDQLRLATASTRYRTDQMRIEVHEQAIAIADQRARLVSAQDALERFQAETKRIQQEQLAQYRVVKASREQAEELLLLRTATVRLRGEIRKIIDLYVGAGHIPASYTDKLIWPMQGRVSQEFGCTGFPWEPPLGKCAHFHRGIDLVAPNGTAIKSAGDGVVVFVGYNPYDPPGNRAWIVLVAHAENLITWYGHLQPRIPPDIGIGVKVKAGDVIGWEGSTGRSTGPHLHWMVQFESRFVNPRVFV